VDIYHRRRLAGMSIGNTSEEKWPTVIS
jgi:hypothetical protein